MKNQFSLAKTVALLSATVMLSVANNTVLAADGKTLPGTNCVDHSNQNDVSYASFNGYLINDLNGYNRVQCPVVRETMAGRSNHFDFVRVQLQKFGGALELRAIWTHVTGLEALEVLEVDT